MFSGKKNKPEIKKGPVLACIHYGVCSEGKCHFWTSFETTVIDKQTKEAKTVTRAMCGFKWIPQLMIETRNSIDRINNGIHAKSTNPN